MDDIQTAPPPPPPRNASLTGFVRYAAAQRRVVRAASEGAPAAILQMHSPPAEPVVAPINGWVPDATKPCYGLPGASAPLGFFDPLGFSKDKELVGVKRLREAEIMHGRVASTYFLSKQKKEIA